MVTHSQEASTKELPDVKNKSKNNPIIELVWKPSALNAVLILKCFLCLIPH